MPTNIKTEELTELVKKSRNAVLDMIDFMDEHMLDLADEQKAEYDALYAAYSEATSELDSYIGL